MKLIELLEGRNSPCIVVDVQPEYTGYDSISPVNWIDEMMHFLNMQGNVLMFVNAEQDGLTSDTVQDVQMYWAESGYDERKWNQTEIVDKGYGHFRSWMGQGIDDATIIRTIRAMYQQRVYDSRSLFGGEDSETYIQDMATLGVPEHILDEYFRVEWTSVAQLKRFSGSYLMGGGRDECLREVTLLMNAFNIKYRLVNEFIYG